MLSLFLLVAASTAAQATGWSVFPGDGAAAENATNVHDPNVVQIGNKAFCFSTSGDGFGVVRSTTDFKSWKVLGPILPRQPEWLAKRYRHKSIWAPDVVVLGRKLRVYYTASNFGTNESVIGLAENPNFDPERPLEGWRDLGLVVESKPGDPINAIDAEVLVDVDARQWLFFGSYWSGIQLLELDPATGKPRPGAKPVGVARNTIERGDPIEGAAVLRRGGYYYLFVSYGLAAQGVRSTYRIMVGRSESPTGPYVDRKGKPMSEGGYVNVLKTSPPMMAPGHNEVLRLRDGRTVMPYHFYDARRAWFGDNWGMPTLQIRELLWSNDGWPLPGLPIEAPRPKAGASPVGRWVYQADFGQPVEVELRESGELVGGDGGRWRREGEDLVLVWVRAGGRVDEQRLLLAYDGGYFVGRDDAGAVVRGYRQGEGKR